MSSHIVNYSFLAAYCIGKALDLKYKDDYLFTNNSGNGFGCSFTDDKDEFVIKDKKIMKKIEILIFNMYH